VLHESASNLVRIHGREEGSLRRWLQVSVCLIVSVSMDGSGSTHRA
jgi:hypothetical protein